MNTDELTADPFYTLGRIEGEIKGDSPGRKKIPRIRDILAEWNQARDAMRKRGKTVFLHLGP